MRLYKRSSSENTLKEGSPILKKQPSLLTEFSEEFNGTTESQDKLNSSQSKKKNDEMFEEEERAREHYDG